jgi:DHA1 family bicyclomycin/chloramphenicol resistance-like MFS transporter
LILAIFLGVALLLPETKGADPSYSIKPSAIIKSYRQVISQSYFSIYAGISSLSFAGLFIYIASSPGIFMQQYGLTQKQYGLLFAFLASGLIIASQINTFLLRRYRSETIIKTAFLIQLAVTMLFLSLMTVNFNNLVTTVGMLYLFLGAAGLIMPNATALAMKPFDANAGSASALLGFIQMGLGSIFTIVIGLLNIQSALPMVVCMMGASGFALLVLQRSKAKLIYVETRAEKEVA